MDKRIVTCIIMSYFIFLNISCSSDEGYPFYSYDDPTIYSTSDKIMPTEVISYGNIYIGYKSLLPGETASEIISDGRDEVKFPMSAQLQFYMISGTNKVFLKSKEVYSLNADQHRKIVINNNTEVVNPMKTTTETDLKMMHYDK
ncbi:hypothetical protein EZS27_014697 [termite gut metagenome]|uniref:Uncharacterized protein n=1 Tax=termite gut metagenome TaxID=433724 RepID=A0A5J4RVA8_9ZZZZ